jgi:hypothetical protein
LTPLPTELPEALTTLTPLAPFSALPERLTLLLSVLVTDELFAAIAPVLPLEISAWPAVTLSIWLSLMACGALLLVWGFAWPYAAPAVKAEAVIKVQISLFIAASMGMLKTSSTVRAAARDCARTVARRFERLLRTEEWLNTASS